MSVDDDPLNRLETALQRIAFSVHNGSDSVAETPSAPVKELETIGAHIDLLVARIDDVLARCDSEDEVR